jgi:hypothetical protein
MWKKKWKKGEKIDLNLASLCFALKQKLLNRSEAKNFKRKKVQKNRKNRGKIEKSEKNKKNVLEFCFFVSLRSNNY